MNKTKEDRIFTWLKVNQKLKFIKDYDSFTAKNKDATLLFILELDSEILALNHKVVFMALSLGLYTHKITNNLQYYWNFCYKYRLEHEAYRNILIQFPKSFKNQQYEIYKELGDIEFQQAKGYFIDVDFHTKEAIGYYKKINAQSEIDKCLQKLQKNKINTSENYPKPTEIIIPYWENIKSNVNDLSEGSTISRVTRSSSDNLIYNESSINSMIALQVIKQNIVANLITYLKENDNTDFENFLDYFGFKDCWFYGTDIYKIMLPALFHFYQNFKLDINEIKFSQVNYVLPLDSLVLKFEGILRLFIEKKGITTINESGASIRENISFFTLISQFETSIKYNALETARFIEEDKPFFEHLFNSNELNLRNEIAHSFFKMELYSYKSVAIIIDAIIRLGKYTLVKL
jgi:hypothetical protein